LTLHSKTVVGQARKICGWGKIYQNSKAYVLTTVMAVLDTGMCLNILMPM
jgi:hypothetical protein